MSLGYKKMKSEAVGYVYYQASTGAWDFLPPTQTATGASAAYDQAPKKEGWMGYLIKIGDVIKVFTYAGTQEKYILVPCT